MRHTIGCIRREFEQHGARCKVLESNDCRFVRTADSTEHYCNSSFRNWRYNSVFLDNGAYPRLPYRVLTEEEWRKLGGDGQMPPTATVDTLSGLLRLTSADNTFWWTTPCGPDKEVHVLVGNDAKRVEVSSWLNNTLQEASETLHRAHCPAFLPALELQHHFPALLRCVMATLLSDHVLDKHVIVVYLHNNHAMFGVFRSVFGLLWAITEPTKAPSRKVRSVFREEGLARGEFGTMVGLQLRDAINAILPCARSTNVRSTYL